MNKMNKKIALLALGVSLAGAANAGVWDTVKGKVQRAKDLTVKAGRGLAKKANDNKGKIAAVVVPVVTASGVVVAYVVDGKFNDSKGLTASVDGLNTAKDFTVEQATELINFAVKNSKTAVDFASEQGLGLVKAVLKKAHLTSADKEESVSSEDSQEEAK